MEIMNAFNTKAKLEELYKKTNGLNVTGISKKL